MAHEHTLIRSALAAALAAEDDLDVLAEAGDEAEVLHAVDVHAPDVLVLSASLAPRGGVDICRKLRGTDGPQVLLVSADEDHALLVQALEAGATGYLAGGAQLQDLVAAVHALARGEAVVPPRMLGGLLHDLVVRRRRQGAASERWDRLSRREREVLALLAQGLDQDGIAGELVISPQTARTHIQNVLGKLQVHSRLEAVALALEHGLLEVS